MHKFKIVILANNDVKREKGLMFTKPLKPNEVAYFTFPKTGCYGFWNKNVSYDLTLAFVDENHKIIDFKELKAEQEKNVYPDSDFVKYVIEASSGVFKNANINIGDVVHHQDEELIIY
jgi:uncharacterized membrane protein (UPF0127 family)